MFILKAHGLEGTTYRKVLQSIGHGSHSDDDHGNIRHPY
jgi:hypothetical protein